MRGIPKGQPRPRAFARIDSVGRAKARVYDPGTAEAWKSAVVVAGASARPKQPIEGPVSVVMYFMMPRPKRLYRKKDPAWGIPCPSKPDWDNLAKGTLDAMTADGWWRDDAQIVDARVSKNYHEKDGAPGAMITVAELVFP